VTTKTEETSPLTKALAAATKATAAAYDAIEPAEADLAAARQALGTANTDLLTSVVVKNPDPKAAKTRIEGSRAKLKLAADEVEWCVLKAHAVEVQYQQAVEAEQAARHAVFVEEYQAEHEAFNDPGSRENTLLARVTADVSELFVLLGDRKDKHDALSSQWASLPPAERPPVKAGKPIGSTFSRVIPANITAPPEIVEAVKSGLAAADAEYAERRRAAQFG
jgi:hypothetical protein